MSRCPPERAVGGLGSRDFMLLLIASVGTFSNYAPLLSVVPMWAAHGQAVAGGAGAATGVTMAGTVAAQLCMPWLQRRFRLSTVLAAGALVLGVPTFGYGLSSALGWILAVSAVRGAGFGVVAVAGSALVAELVPPSHRGRAVGWYGMAVGLPQVVLLPLGVWTAQHIGFGLVFAATGAASVAACPLILATRLLAGRHAVSVPRPAAGSVRGTGRLRPLARPWLLVIVVSAAFGGITAFVPLMAGGSAIAPAALFGMSAAVIVGRWTAGVRGDRAAPGRLLLPSVAACALGMAGLAAAAFTGAVVLALPAAVVYGLGFGALQNDTLVVMFGRADHGLASTVWNLAIDAGTGVGATAIGWGSGLLGLGGAFGVCAAAIAGLAPAALGIRLRRP